jgi:hypothetical protein
MQLSHISLFKSEKKLPAYTADHDAAPLQFSFPAYAMPQAVSSDWHALRLE